MILRIYGCDLIQESVFYLSYRDFTLTAASNGQWSGSILSVLLQEVICLFQREELLRAVYGLHQCLRKTLGEPGTFLMFPQNGMQKGEATDRAFGCLLKEIFRIENGFD
ncbi:hypothetical protein L6452_05737 [Arctium lappa]|uniref:Uncharacterized protein n=1 Tax=Arctium lappa TaxID=4217 RepID=A0ACB9EGS0_ARCLA|nr:hypothetical protein L6452_05737 [Arctium lappa]